MEPKGPPPPYGFSEPPPPQQMGPTTVVMTTQVIAPGPNSCRLNCPSCGQSIMSRTKYEPTIRTHLFALLLCLICCPLGCIPYCVDSCQGASHYCPSCGAFIGRYEG